MNRRVLSGGGLVFAVMLSLSAKDSLAQAAAPRPAPTPAAAPREGDPRLIERGRYLTHDVAMCVQCHSPRDRHGAIIREEEFRGAPNPFPPPLEGVPWAIRSVNIRGLGGLPEEAVIRLLTTGIGRRGSPPDPPMPPFRMSRADAEAIVAYLRSLD